MRNYDYHLDDEDGVIYIRDQSNHMGGMSVTNAMERVIDDIAQLEGRDFSDYVVIYRDTRGRWNAFDQKKGFIHLGGETQQDAASLWRLYLKKMQPPGEVPGPIPQGKLNAEAAYTTEVIADKQLRKTGDDLIQLIKELPASRERSLAITKFQEGVMWLGMDLKRLGEQNPYPSSKDPSTGNRIEPTADNLKL